jgi:ubiquinol-cytochrome c reductase cytochrome c1 subunit
MLARSALRTARTAGAAARNATSRPAPRFASTSASAEGAGSAWKNNALPAGATIFAVGSTAWYWHLYGRDVDAMTPAEEGLHPTQYPWEHEKWYKTFDHAALRRGFQVYREVCASCHSISRVPY